MANVVNFEPRCQFEFNIRLHVIRLPVMLQVWYDVKTYQRYPSAASTYVAAPLGKVSTRPLHARGHDSRLTNHECSHLPLIILYFTFISSEYPFEMVIKKNSK